MSVSQRKDGRWVVKYKDDGTWRQKAFKDKKTAYAFDDESRQEEIDTKLSLGELAIKFFKSRPEYNQHTKRNIIYFLFGHEDIHKKWCVGRGRFLTDKYAEELTRTDLQTMREAMLESGSSPATCNKMQAYIRGILSWGVENEYIKINPWRDYKRLKSEKPLIQVNADDLLRVYEYLPEWMQWAVQTAYFLCLRPGKIELFGLLWTAFDWRRRVVRVRQGKSGLVKTVYPHPAYMTRARERYEKDMAAGIVHVCHRGGKVVKDYRTSWELACAKAGVSMRFYDIRHIAATMQLSAGADIAAVSAQLGHTHVSTTVNNYAHVTGGAQAKAASLNQGGDHFGTDVLLILRTSIYC